MHVPTQARGRVPRTVLWSLLALAPAAGALAQGSASLIPAKDNTLFFDAEGDVSNGMGQFFFTGANAQGNVRRGVLAFDLSGIPSGSTITAATLRLSMSSGDDEARTTTLHRLLADWGEGASDAPGAEGQGAPAQPNDATWLFNFFPGSAWANAGGDFDPAITAATSVTSPGFYTWSGAGLLADVQSWHADPSSNFGWMIRGDEAVNGSAKRFDSRQNINSQAWPVLEVRYIPVPAPGAGVLLAFAAIGAMRRRR